MNAVTLGKAKIGSLFIGPNGLLTFGKAVSKIVPGATSLSLRNNADSADNLLVSNAGVVTVRAGLVITTGGLTQTAGSLTLGDAASKIVPGATSLSLRNNADSADNVLIADAGGVTLRTTLTFATAASKIIPGATSLALRNNADSADNVGITDAGVVTIRAGLTLTAGRTALNGPLNMAVAGTALVVGTNTITPTKSYHTVDNSGGTVTVKTITAGTGGDILILQGVHATNDVIFDRTGNLAIGAATRTLDTNADSMWFVYNATLTKWCEISFIATNA